MTDIVERLQRWKDLIEMKRFGFMSHDVMAINLRDAADEIEWLRAALRRADGHIDAAEAALAIARQAIREALGDE